MGPNDEDGFPDLPEHCADFSEKETNDARQLLGQRGRGDELGKKARAKLIALVGCYPDPDLARQWKRDLREQRDELRDEIDSD